MRFMIIRKADRMTESGALPSEELLAAMGKYNEELVNAGVMLAGQGLQSSAKGARVKRWPQLDGDGEVEIEIRQLFELEDFGPSAAVSRMREVGFAD